VHSDLQRASFVSETPSASSEFDRFTPAAERVLGRAVRLAAQRGDSTVESEHLLVALVEDESRATEFLAERAFEEERARTLLAALPTASSPTTPFEPAESGDVRLVRLEAARIARLAGEAGTVGSEHLLFALAVVPSAVAEALGEYGLDEAAITRLARREEIPVGEPLEVDFALEFDAQPGSGLPNDITDLREPPAGQGGERPFSRAMESLERQTSATELDVHRIVDAAGNRAREGLRVAEDHVRFVLADAHLVSLLKQVRHDLASAMTAFHPLALVRARDTNVDVGTTVSTEAEGRRDSAGDVLRAALARTGEALRTLEEYGKLLVAGAGPRFERLRYRLYTIEKAVLGTAAAGNLLAGRSLYLLLTRELCRREPGEVVREAIRGGVSIVQLREKSLPDRAFVEWACEVRRWTREGGALLVVNDRPDLAVLCDADGVHVGQEELSVRQARRILGPRRLVGVSTHDLPQARQAVLDGADYLGVGPTFPSRTKSFAGFAGLEFVREMAGEIALPWYAIGGIDRGNLPAVLEAGGTRIAVTGAICAAEDPATAATELSLALRGRPLRSHVPESVRHGETPT
jgi:thiamine-phosphate pyrophosphorylase